jgi:hypothetical protein
MASNSVSNPEDFRSGVIPERWRSPRAATRDRLRDHLTSSVVRAWVRVGVAAAVAALAVVVRQLSEARTNGADGWEDTSAVSGVAIVFLVLVSPLLLAPLAKSAWQLIRHENRRRSPGSPTIE